MKTKEEYKERILEILDHNCKSDYNSFYETTEEYMYSFFESKKDNFSKESFYQSLLMIYGWMPTIPYQNKDFIEITDTGLLLLSKAYDHKREKRFSEDEMEKLIPFVNNSIVGLSKMLHFINKGQYAIWDSKIARLFGLRHNYQVQNINQYLNYNEAMLSCAESALSLRDIELRLFIYSSNKNNQ